MSPKTFDRLTLPCTIGVTVPPLVTGLMNKDVLEQGLAHLGAGTYTSFVAIAAATGFALGFGSLFHVCLKGVARLNPQRRRKAIHGAIGATVILLGSSALPTVQQLGGGTAEILAAQKIASELRKGSEKVKRANESFKQVIPVVGNRAVRFDDFQRAEAQGMLSGRVSEGVVAHTIAAHAKRFRQIEATLQSAQERLPDLVARLDDATQRFIEAAGDMSRTAAERAAMKQRAFDDARNALLVLSQLMPIAALSTFVAELTGEQVRPVLSVNTDTRERQEAALAKVEAELRRAAYDLDPRLRELARALKIDIPVYEWKPQSLLVLEFWWGVLNYWAVAIGLDVIPLLIILLVARLHDGVMGWDDDDEDGVPPSNPKPANSPSGDVPLGAHPLPRATAARASQPSKPDKIKEDA